MSLGHKLDTTAGLDAYHAVMANGRRSIGSNDYYLSMMDLLGQDVYCFDSLHNLWVLRVSTDGITSTGLFCGG